MTSSSRGSLRDNIGPAPDRAVPSGAEARYSTVRDRKPDNARPVQYSWLTLATSGSAG